MSQWGLLGAVCAITVACCGCGGPVRLYEGKPLPAKEACRLYNTSRAYVRSVDGRYVFRSSHTADTSFELEPGHHRVRVGPPATRDPARDLDDLYHDLEWDFEPGRSYSFVIAEIRSGAGGRGAYNARPVDYHTGRHVLPPPRAPRSGGGVVRAGDTSFGVTF